MNATPFPPSPPAPAEPAPSARVSPDNPWPGLETFTESMRGYFFGRGEEIEELFRLVKREALTVFYGQSGLGKSSLLQAGLFPKLRAAEFVPLYLHLDHDEHAPTLAAQVRAAVNEAIRAGHFDAPPCPDDEALWTYFHRRDVDFWDARNRLVTPVLVFDQFEELFTLGRENSARQDRGRAFVEELACLIERRPPAELARQLEAGEADPARFHFDHEFVKVVLSLREDFLAELDSLSSAIRGILTNRLRLKHLTAAQARQAVEGPGGHLLEPGVAEQIVRFVAGLESAAAKPTARTAPEETPREVEPALLSLVCRELAEKRPSGQPRISGEMVATLSHQILRDFYERTMAKVPEAVRGFVEVELLTDSGYRDNVALERALAQPGVTLAALKTLEEARLLRIDTRLGVKRVELTHDVLTRVVRVSRDARQQRQAARRRVRERITLLAVCLALAATLAVAGYINHQRAAIDVLRHRAQAVADARSLAAKAETLLDQPGRDVALALLLSIESLRAEPTLEGDRAIRRGLALLPRPLGHVPTETKGGPVSATFDPAGQFLAVGFSNRMLRVYDLRGPTPQPLAAVELPGRPVELLSTPDGHALIIATTRGTVFGAAAAPRPLQVWDAWTTATPTPVPVLRTNFADAGGALAVSPDSRYLATSVGSTQLNRGGGSLRGLGWRVDDLRTGATLARFHTPTNRVRDSITRLAFGPDSRTLAVAAFSLYDNWNSPTAPGELTVWDWAKSNRLAETGLSAKVLGLELAAGYLRASDREDTAVWNFATDAIALTNRVRFDHPAAAVTISDDGRFLVAQPNWANTLELWSGWWSRLAGLGASEEGGEGARRDSMSGVRFARLAGAHRVIFDSAGVRFATLHADGVHLWDSRPHSETARFPTDELAHPQWATLRFSTNDEFLGWADETAGVTVYRATTQERIAGPFPGAVGLAFSDDQTRLAIASPVEVTIHESWTSPQSRVRWRLPAVHPVALVFARDGAHLAMLLEGGADAQAPGAAGNHLEVWTLPAAGEPRRLNRIPTGWERQTALLGLTSDGARLAAGSESGAKLWSQWTTATPRLEHSFDVDANAFSLAPDASAFVSYTREGDDGKTLLQPLIGPESASRNVPVDFDVQDLAIAPGGKLLALAGEQQVEVWRVQEREPVHLVTVGEPIEMTMISPSGRYLATGSAGGLLQLWSLPAEDLIREATARVNRELTPAERERYLREDSASARIPSLAR